MAYIVVVNPVILTAAGMPFEASMAATILAAFFGTIAVGIYANRPFAIAPYMGENAFMAYTVVGLLGYSWQTALGAVFISGVLFTLLTLSGYRKKFAEAIPFNLKASFAVGIGLFITFIGLVNAGIIVSGMPGTLVKMGNLNSPSVLLAVGGFLLMCIFLIRKIKGSLLLGIILTSIIGFISGITPYPQNILGNVPDISPVFLQLDIFGALTWGFFAVILTMFTMDFLDTIGTLIGLSVKANLTDENGNLPEIEKPMLVDALATVAGSLLGTSTTGHYIEAASGIEEGGRTGLAAVTTAFLFLLCLPFAPFFSSIPPQATGAALIIVGMLMISPIKHIDFNDYTEVIPAFGVITLMIFTYNIGVGLCSGFILYPLVKVVAGKHKEIKAPAWVLFILCSLFFIFYPY
jgi:AGZA family xanthine/uracil permease-like MFS transporter